MMETCPGCERTFNGKVKLEKHMKGCDYAKALKLSSTSGIRDCIVPEGSMSHFHLLNGMDKDEIKFPKTYACYICGKEYGSKSISIHEKQCAERFQKQQERRPSQERKKLPKRPFFEKATSLEERNAWARASFENHVMVACPGCKRTFEGESKLEKHTKGCDYVKELNQSSSGIRIRHNNILNLSGIDENNHKAPRTYVCYLCGKEYGSESISIHEKQCAELFKKQQEQLPVKERKSLPRRPSFEKATSLEERNSFARESFENMMMVICPGCGRTFNESTKLEKHMKGCNHVKKLRHLSSGFRDCIVPEESTSHNDLLKLNGIDATPKTYVCYICGEEYGSKSISVHEKHCAQLFKKRQELLPEEERKSLPRRPSFEKATSLEERNILARASFEIMMEACPGCGRSFNEMTKLEKHMKGCDHVKKLIKQSSGIRDHRTSEESISRIEESNLNRTCENKNQVAPILCVCYICGEECASESISIHERQCAEFFKKQQGKLPIKERKTLPKRPSFERATSLEERNSWARASFNETCLGYKRTFNEIARLEKQEKGCDHVKKIKLSTSGIQGCIVLTEGTTSHDDLLVFHDLYDIKNKKYEDVTENT